MVSVEVRELAWTQAWSLRQSRAKADPDALAACFGMLGRTAPAKPNRLTGGAEAGCGWLEPHAWLITGALAAPAELPGSLLLTEISDRLAHFVVSGAGATDLIAAGCDPHIVPIGGMARTRFGGLCTAIVQRWGGTEYRLMVDVSIGPAFAAWLVQAAGTVQS